MKQEKSPLAIILEKLCKLPNCTFKANTPDGELTIVITGKESKWSKTEYDIQKKVTMKKEDGTLFSTINYRDCCSASSNSGGFHLQEIINYNPDETHPQGYKKIYEHFQNTQAIDYKIDENNYQIQAGVVFANGNSFRIKNNILRNELNNHCAIGIDINSEQILAYLKTGKIIDKERTFAVNGLDLTTKKPINSMTVIDHIEEEIEMPIEKAKVKIEEQGINLESVIEYTKQIVDIYKKNIKLFENYHSKDTLIAILEASHKSHGAILTEFFKRK